MLYNVLRWCKQSKIGVIFWRRCTWLKVEKWHKRGYPEREQNLEMKVVVVRSQCQDEYHNKKRGDVLMVTSKTKKSMSRWISQREKR